MRRLVVGLAMLAAAAMLTAACGQGPAPRTVNVDQMLERAERGEEVRR